MISTGVSDMDKVHINEFHFLQFQLHDAHIYVENMSKIVHFSNFLEENSSGIPVTGLW